MQQLMLKSAGKFDAAAKLFGRFAPRLEAAAPKATMDIAGGVGRGLGRVSTSPVAAARTVGSHLMGTPGEAGAISRLVGGLGEGALANFGETGKRLGKSFNQLATSRVAFGAPKPMAAAAEGAATGGAAKVAPAVDAATTAPAASAAPGTMSGGATPGTLTPEQLNQMTTTNRGWTGGPGGSGAVSNEELAALGLVSPTSGDPTGGLLGRIKGMLPQGAQDWIGKNPNLASAGAGALGGGGMMYAGDAYGDAQRRKALENLGMMDRLGLAFQLATNPQGFASTLRL